MDNMPPFPLLLEQITQRSAALREAAAEAGPGAAVPGCPGWSVHDLLAHLGEVQRFWAAVVTAGPGQPPPEDEAVPGRLPGDDVLAWSAESTSVLLAALREAGPGRGCWTWWERSSAPQDSASVARHQVQEAAVHARDAQEAAGRPEPLPLAVAVDGVTEFLTVGLGAMGPWPHAPAQVALRADEGQSWLLRLGPDGAGIAAGPGEATAATVSGTASDLVLFLYGRQGREMGRPAGGPVRVEGDQDLVRQLTAWAPTS